MRIDFTYKMHCLKALRLVFIALIMMGGAPLDGWAQTKEYANSQENGKNSATILLGAISGGYSPTNDSNIANVEEPDDAVDADEVTYATMKARNVSILLADYTGEAWLQMNYENQVNANTTTYIKIDAPTATGFNLDLLTTVGGLLGLLDENIIIPEVYNGANMVSSSNVHSTMARDADGNLYLAVTSSVDYTGVRIKLRSQSNLLGLSIGGGVELKVYEAFHYTDAPTCGRPLHTYYEDSGISIDLLDFDNQNLEHAIDNDTDSYALIKSGALLGVSVTGTMSQNFNFETESTETSTLNIKLALGSGGLINTDLLGSIQVLLYDANGQEVYNQALQSSLLNNTDILDILGTGAPATLTFAPGKAFSRAEVKLNSVVGVNLLGNGVRIYDVQRYDGIGTCTNPAIAALPTATADPFDEASCSSDLIDFDNVDFAHRAVDGNNESYATIYADAGNLLVSGPTAGFIEMDLGQTVPANKTTYVRINYDEDVLDRLVGGSLGKLVSDLANNSLLGNQYFEVEAKNGNSSVLKEKSSDAFEGTADGVVTLVQDDIGRFYIAITPDSDYDRIRITNHVTAVLSTGKKASLDVYNACFEIGTDNCFPPNFTSYRGGGIGLNVGNISSVGVTNAYRAISENSSEYSEINLGVAGLVANVYQTIYFSQPSQANDKVKIRVALEPSSALALDVLGRYQVRFFNGATQVGNDETLESGLINNLDLVALFGSGGIVELEYEPNGIFDRVEIGAESIASVNVATEPLRLYSVDRYGDSCPLTKTEFPFEVPSCSTSLLASHNADNVQNLFDDDFDSYATLKSGAGFLLGLGDKYEGYVEMGYDQPVDAGVTSYIRIDFEETILEGLVGGSLGNVVSGLLNGLVLGDHFFTVEVKDASANILHSASSNQASAGGDDAIRVVQDAAGRYYIAVTPTADYQSVRITDGTNSVLGLLAEPNTMNVYGMCTDLVEDPCFGPFATSYEHEGLSLSVNDLGGAGVTNGSYAINGNTTNYSEISNGTLGVGASTKQWILFNSVSDDNDVATIKFKTEDGVVDADILGGLEIKAYLGNNEVYNVTSQNGIINGVNVAQLLTNGQMVDLDIAPGQKFDRISIGIKTLAEVAIFPPIHLYEVGRICEDDQTITMPDCIQDCNENAFLFTSDPNTLEYDNFISGYHATIIKQQDGNYLIWGQNAKPNTLGEHLYEPTLIIPENGFNYIGDILKATLGTSGTNLGTNDHFAILTTDGLYIWGDGTRDAMVHRSVKNTITFDKMTDTNITNADPATGLPVGVAPTDVKMLFGSYATLGIVTCTGEAYVISHRGNKNGDGTVDNAVERRKWHRISTAPGIPLNNVVAMRGVTGAMVALTSDGELYTWGSETYLGDGSAKADRLYATQMTLPAGVTPKMIGMTKASNTLSSQSHRLNSYYLLSTTGELYSLGDNSQKQLGTFDTDERTTWVNVKSTDASTNMTNIVWISPNEHDNRGHATVTALTADGKLWGWGMNNFRMLGEGNDDAVDPRYMFGGLDHEEKVLAIETGGHITTIFKDCEYKLGYIGHNINGSYANDNPQGISGVFQFDGAKFTNLCAIPLPPYPEVSNMRVCYGETADLTDAMLNSAPAGYTLEWWTTIDRTAGTEVVDPTTVTPGTYYAFFARDVDDCPQLEGQEVIVEQNPTTVLQQDVPDIITSVNNDYSYTVGTVSHPDPLPSGYSVQYTWEYATADNPTVWNVLDNTTFPGEITLTGSTFSISHATKDIDGIKVRVTAQTVYESPLSPEVIGPVDCITQSNEFLITIKAGAVVTNPMLLNRAK